MKDIYKTLIAVVGLLTVFVIGFSLGKTKSGGRFPSFRKIDVPPGSGRPRDPIPGGRL